MNAEIGRPGSRRHIDPVVAFVGSWRGSRKAMMRAMVTYLLENGKIETTVTRAKDVRSMAEKMITLGKSSDLHTKRQVGTATSPRKMWQRSCRRDQYPSTLTATAATPAS